MKKLIFLLLLPAFGMAQNTVTVGNAATDADSLNSKAPSYYVDTATAQNISGIKTFEGSISIGDTTGFVLSSAAATVTSQNNVILDTEGAAALDTVTTLTGTIGQIVYISTRNSGRDVRFLDSGNFSLGAERTLTDVADVLVLKATTTTTWKEISFISNN